MSLNRLGTGSKTFEKNRYEYFRIPQFSNLKRFCNSKILAKTQYLIFYSKNQTRIVK